MSVELAKDAEGNYAIGATIEGVFVPFATVAPHVVSHAQERYATLTKRAGDPTAEGYGPAVDALTGGYNVLPGPKSDNGEGLSSKTKAELVELAESEGVEGVTSSSTKAEIIEAIETSGYSEGGS